MPAKNSLLAALILFILCPIALAENLKIDSAEIKWHRYYDEVMIDTSDYTIPKVIEAPDRITLVFKDAEIAQIATTLRKSPRIKVIRSESSGEGDARLIIELKRPVKYELAAIYGKGEVIIEIADPKVPTIYFKEDNGTQKRQYYAHHQPIKVEVLAPIAGEEGNVSRVLRGKRVVVDPGHGGEDPGAFSLSGAKEKDLTLSTALYLAEYLRKSGASVYMTRRTDVKHDLPDIAEFTNKVRADIYIGVHYNSILGRRIAGTETYYYTPESFRLAGLVHKQMLINLRREDRGVKRARFYTISHAGMPAILIEPVYLTDRQEGMLAENKNFQKNVAASVARGIRDYYTR